MLKLYVNSGSGSACVEAALAELDIPFQRVRVNYTEEGIDDPSFAEINPRMQIPVLVFDGGECLTETFAILSYFANKYPASGLAPKAGTFERAKLDQWMSFILANIYEGELRKNYPQRFVIGDASLVAEAAEQFVLSNYQLIEAACSNEAYFFGDKLTIVDLYLWMFVNWFEDLEEISTLCPKIVGIADRVMSRPKIAPIHQFNFGEGLGWNDINQ